MQLWFLFQQGSVKQQDSLVKNKSWKFCHLVGIFLEKGAYAFLQAETLLISKHPYATLKSVYSLSSTAANNNGRSTTRPGPIVPVIHHIITDCHAIFLL